MTLKARERDELLVRIDERVKAIKDGDEGDIPEIKEHLKVLNSQVAKNTTFRKFACWIAGVLFVAAVSLVASGLI